MYLGGVGVQNTAGEMTRQLRMTTAQSKDLSSNSPSPYPVGGSQLPVMPVPRDLMPYFGPCW